MSSWAPDAPSTEDILAAVFSSSLPAVPPQEQQIGDTLVSWWETDPGEVYIHAEGGSPDDRHYAKSKVRLELEEHGYRHAQFDFDDAASEQLGSHAANSSVRNGRTAAWTDLMAKAKRLIQSGQVQMLRNGFNYIVGHVQGDHGDYDTEISRDDPNSRAITGWQCSCPWDQYAWQRTRKWKKFEGRPCAHVLALYWKALSTPMDEDLSPEQQNAMGTGQKLPAPPVEEHAPNREPGMNEAPGHHPEPNGLPRSFGPEGDVIQGDQLGLQGMPPEATGGPPGPAQAPLAPPPGAGGGQGSPMGPEPSGILPPFPGEQQQMEWAGPGTTPGGMESPPGAYTVPGAKPQTPANPLQIPGTYSHTMDWADYFGPWDVMYHGTPVDPQVLANEGLIASQPGPEAPGQEPGVYLARTPDQARYWGPHVVAVDTRDLDLAQDPYSDSGPHAYYYSPHDIPPERVTPHDASTQREAAWMDEPQIERCPNCLSPMRFKAQSEMAAHELPEEHPHGALFCTNPNCYTSRPPGLEQFPFAHPDPWMDSEPGSLTLPDHWSRTAADFQAPQVVRLKKPMLGIAHGPVKGQYGDGEYREVPEGTLGEVLSQDKTTGWVEAAFPLDDSGPHEPFHVQCFLEPQDIELTDSTNAFIRRR